MTAREYLEQAVIGQSGGSMVRVFVADLAELLGLELEPADAYGVLIVRAPSSDAPPPAAQCEHEFGARQFQPSTAGRGG